MTQEALAALAPPWLLYTEARTGLTVRSGTLQKVAMTANLAALGRPAKCLQVQQSYGNGAAARTWVAGYTRTGTHIKGLYLSAFYRAQTAGDQLQITLTITDTGGASVISTDSRVAGIFRGTAQTLFEWSGPYTTSFHRLGADAWLDLDALATTLTAADWSLEFSIQRPSGIDATVDLIEGWEVPRGLVDDTDPYGIIMGHFLPGRPIVAGVTGSGGDGLQRLSKTIEGGILGRQLAYLDLHWPEDTTLAIPRTTSAAYAAITDLTEAASTSMRFEVRARPVYATSSSTGEPSRFRVRYQVTGGGTARVKGFAASSVTTNSTESADLTSATWAWSAWIAVKLPTDGASQGIVELYLEGKTSAGTLYLSTIQWDEDTT